MIKGLRFACGFVWCMMARPCFGEYQHEHQPKFNACRNAERAVVVASDAGQNSRDCFLGLTDRLQFLEIRALESGIRTVHYDSDKGPIAT